jgi:uncharacterized protein
MNYNQSMKTELLQASVKQIKEFCQRHHIRRMAFFGSVVREDFGPHSDIDILVEFESGHTPGFDFFLMEAELSKLLGRKVDLHTENFLSPEIRRTAFSESVVAYEQARS